MILEIETFSIQIRRVSAAFVIVLCWVDLCFSTSDDGIDGSGRCFLEYEDSLHTTDRIILTESEGTERD